MPSPLRPGDVFKGQVPNPGNNLSSKFPEVSRMGVVTPGIDWRILKRVMCTKLTTMRWGMEHCKHGVEWQHFASWHDSKGLHYKLHFSLSIVEYVYFVASRRPIQSFHQRSAKSGEPLEQHYTNQYGKFQ